MNDEMSCFGPMLFTASLIVLGIISLGLIRLLAIS
jgi:hypothetical protein